jgi:hypothetical protein
VTSTDSDFTRTFPPWKSGAKASAVPVCWLITAGYLEGKLDRQDITENDPVLRFRYCTPEMDKLKSALDNIGIKLFVLAALKEH